MERKIGVGHSKWRGMKDLRSVWSEEGKGVPVM